MIETKRLMLRKLNKNDFNNLSTILKDEEVMYAYEHAFSDEEVTMWLNKQIYRYENEGFGLLGVILKDTNEFIGQCGLTLQDYKGIKVPEIGYLFSKKYWNKGYAIEAAKAVKEYAFNELHLDEVYSIIRDNNFTSQKVAEKNGMKRIDKIVKHYYDMDMPHYVYMVKNRRYNK